MKWLITFILGVLVGAAILFVALQDVPEKPATEVAATAPAAPGIPASQIEGQLPPAPVVVPNLEDADLPLRPTPDANAATGSAAPTTMPGKLLVPVQGIKSAQLTDTFYQPRGEQRQHEALDIMAPTGTPVVAVADGKVAKLFHSKPGGLTVYQFDPTGQFAYYYAHLDRYADGIAEGMEVKRGTLIGYVGVTGNSDPNAPHLHFAVVALTPEKQWWKGTPLNPFPLMSDQ
ncbi:murein DD-endopeptidase MepM/ murein hydrolase activator NlpD [Massilia aurea]|uniref:Murein DD-endopeptidase MepM/ murein hydrolase activator NlpD n=1 Tax=Massilia aurea TaxID=373040 RepID=A0A7W9WVX1_9BURK|nr:M23 family metallopeptidase [Massilia aurea]MBB6132559.1 murein DD-endopeptidase MepM/ murein hydrolase activator NlpD [Massilia aurea]